MFTKSDKSATVPDEYVLVFSDNNPFWRAKLSDGTEVYQDDGRPDMNPNSWLRLKKYCYDNDLSVEEVRFRFAGYEHLVYQRSLSNDDCGCYFSRGCSALLTEENSKSWDLYVIGSVRVAPDGNGKEMDVARFEVPMLELHSSNRRPVVEANELQIIYHMSCRHDFEEVYIPDSWNRDNSSSVHS